MREILFSDCEILKPMGARVCAFRKMASNENDAALRDLIVIGAINIKAQCTSVCTGS